MSFPKSKSIGDMAEDAILAILLSAGLVCRKTDGRKHDVIVVLDSRDVYAEIKFDKMSEKTKNIALEFFNSKSNKDSGFLASTAELWFHVTNISDGIWVTSPKKIKEFTKANKPKRTVYKAGDDNADIMLYSIDDMEKFAVNISTMKPEEMILCLMSILK